MFFFSLSLSLIFQSPALSLNPSPGCLFPHSLIFRLMGQFEGIFSFPPVINASVKQCHHKSPTCPVSSASISPGLDGNL